MTTSKDQKTIIVLGMHRSGTSVVAELLSALGVYMGEDLLRPDPYNPRGYFEDTQFVSLNDEILRNAGGSWDRPPAERAIVRRNEHLTDRIKSTVEKGHKLWGWKDPRTALTADLFLKHIKNAFFICCFRNPYDVALSLQERDGLGIIDGLELTAIYNERLVNVLKTNKSIPFLSVRFEHVVFDPQSVIQELARFLDVECSAVARQTASGVIVPPRVVYKERKRTRDRRLQDVQTRLTVVEDELRSLYNSRGWKFASFIHRLRRNTPFLRRF